MTCAGAIEHIGFEHGVMCDVVELNAIASQYIGVVLQMLTYKVCVGAFQQWLEGCKYRIAIELVFNSIPFNILVAFLGGLIGGFTGWLIALCARLYMCQWHISRRPSFNGKRQTDNFSLHVVKACGLGIKREQLCRH